MKWFQKHDRVEIVIKNVDEGEAESCLLPGGNSFFNAGLGWQESEA